MVEARIDTPHNGIAIVVFSGRLDFLSVNAARLQIAATVDGVNRWLVVDLGETAFIASSGLGALIGELTAACKADGDLRVARPTEQARGVLSLASLDRGFRCYPSVAEALADDDA